MWRSISQRVQALKWSMSTSSPCKWQSLRLSLERVAGASTAWAYPTASARSTMVMFCLAQIGVSWSLTSTRSPFAKNYSYSLAHVHHNLACYMFWQIPTYWNLWQKKTCSGLKARRPCRAPPSSARWWRLSLSPGLTSRAHWMTWFRPTTSRTKSLAGQLEPPYMLYKLWRRVESLVKLKMDSSSSSSLSMPQLRLLCRIATVTSGTFDFKPIHSLFNIFHVQDWNSHIPNFWFQTCTFSFQHYLSTLPKNCNASEPEVAHTPLAVPITDFQLGHGTAKFQKADKIAAMKREGKSGRDNLNVAVVYWWTCLQRMDSKFKLPFLLNQSLWHLRISGSSWWQRCEVFRI